MRGRETAVKVYHPSGCICKHCKYGHVSYRPLEDMGRLKKKKVLNKVPLVLVLVERVPCNSVFPIMCMNSFFF